VVHVENGFGYGAIEADVHVFQDRGPVYLLGEHRSQRREADTEWLLEQPSRLLTAGYQVVDFTGRDQDRAALEAWRDQAGPRLSARWLHAPGGQGKTRLAAEFAAESAAAGWKVVTATHGPGAIMPPPGSQDMRLGNATGLLLIVDYADRWPLSHLTWLFSNALFHRPLLTRLLLLARSTQPWSSVRSALSDLHAATSDHLLPPIATGVDLGERDRMFTVARDCFARRYGVTDHVGIKPPDTLRHPDFGLVLALHMAALAAVDAHVRGVTPPMDVAGLSAYLLDRERKHWTRLYENRVEGLDFQTPPSLMARAVFAASLTGTTTYSQGLAILGGLDLEVHPDRLLTDHTTCYPPAAAGAILEPLYPDRLAEDFLALTLPGHAVTAYPSAAWAVPAAITLTVRERDGLAPAHISRAITLLAAAAQDRWPHVAAHLNSVLKTDPALAVDAGSAALTALSTVPDLSFELLEAIDSLLPIERHVSLDPGIAAVASRLFERRLAVTADPAERARLFHELAKRQSNAGAHQSAVAVGQEAVAIRRRLALTDPRTHEPDLANSLDNLGIYLAEVGRHQDALSSVRQAVTIRRRLAGADPAAHEPGLARSLDNLGIRLASVGEQREGLAAAQEATAIHRRLAADDPSADEGALADSLDNLGIHLSDSGRHREALATAREATNAWRSLAAAEPERYEPALARSLTGLGAFLHRTGYHDEALAVSQESAAVWRRLAAANPPAHEPGLARALGNLSVDLSQLGHRDEALAAGQESAAVWRRLAAANPPAHEPDLARHLGDLGVHLSRMGRRDEALEFEMEMVAIWRRLAAATPTVHEPGLAYAVGNLAANLFELGRRNQALELGREAVEIRRRSAAANPLAHEPDLAHSLSNLGLFLSAAGRHQDALTAEREAVEIRRRLAAANPLAHEPDLADSLVGLGTRLSEVGEGTGALAATREAVAIWRRLAAATPLAREPDLALALGNLGVRLSEGGHQREALTTTHEVVEIYRRLTAHSPRVYERHLATMLLNLGAQLSEVGDIPGALATTREAVAVWERLAAANPAAHEHGLALSTGNLSAFLREAGEHEDALVAAEQAVAIYRRLSAEDPAAFELHLANSLDSLGTALFGMNLHEDALVAAEQATAIQKRLAAENPAAEPRLAQFTSNLGNRQSAVGRHQDALASMTEAVTIHRRLAMDDAAAHEPGLARSLWAAASMRVSVGIDPIQAVELASESVGVYERLANELPEAYAADLRGARITLADALEAADRTQEAEDVRRRLVNET
jgi:tetratricopeptide (TPR) repeat protein